MENIKGTKTEKNLLAAFAGESQAYNKYQYYASKAREDGYIEIAEIFEETARNEQAHAKIWFKLLHNEEIPSTEENLFAAAKGENFEWTDMYVKMEEEAKEEGFYKIAFLFNAGNKIENEHEQRFLKLLDDVMDGVVCSKDKDMIWQCTVCGHIAIGKKPPEICPVCAYPKSYFKAKSECS